MEGESDEGSVNLTGKPKEPQSATFFATPSELRKWFENHHDERSELWVGYFKKRSGKPSVTWQESVDEALCFGWIDGVRKSLDDSSYMIRFTPRTKRSIWSAVNIKRVAELTKQKRMHQAGVKAFEARGDDRSAIYSYEQRRNPILDPAYEKELRANRKAWNYWTSRPPSYRKAATWWIVSAKREETRRKRLAQLIDESEHGRPVPPLAPPRKASR
jgi:uncharacterized protein YdeI (YjbR/CyaY-like superfamily)